MKITELEPINISRLPNKPNQESESKGTNTIQERENPAADFALTSVPIYDSSNKENSSPNTDVQVEESTEIPVVADKSDRSNLFPHKKEPLHKSHEGSPSSNISQETHNKVNDPNYVYQQIWQPSDT